MSNARPTGAITNSANGRVASSMDVGTQRNQRFDLKVRTRGMLSPVLGDLDRLERLGARALVLNGSRDDQVLMYVDPPAKWQRRTDDYPPTTRTNSAPSHSTPARAAASTAQRTSTGSSQAQAQPHPPQHIRFRWALIHFGIDRVAAIRAAKAAIQSGQRLEQQQKKAQVVGSHSLPARPVSVQVTRQTAGGGGGANNTCSGGAGGGGM
ncbi:hypothetical protein BGW80DRAFT_1258341 [Lactifluus volemus]|nr:hypothetical protein BGW80DRAFT_1258341 [Lactifluus volemus]